MRLAVFGHEITRIVKVSHSILKAYIAKVHTVILGKNYVNIMAQILNSAGKTGDNISKASYLQEKNIITKQKAETDKKLN